MKKCLIAMLLVCVMTIPAMASGYYVVDEADVLSQSEEDTLEFMLSGNSMDVVVAVVPTLGGQTATAFADDFYDYNGYGQGNERSGVVLLLDLGDSNWALSTRGAGLDAFTDAGQEALMDQVLPYFSDGDFYGGFDTFATMAADYIAQYEAGTPYDVGNLPDDGINLVGVLICMVLGALVGGIVVFGHYTQLKSVKFQTGAAAYIRQDSVQVTQQQDLYLGSNVVRRKIERDSGGSSSHTSSSGASHGGSSGKF